MINKFKLKKEYVIALVLVVLLITGGTFAWFYNRYTTTSEIVTFGLIEYEITKRGNFDLETTNDNNAIGKTEVRLLPGRGIDLELSVRNVSTFDTILRYKIEVTTPNFFQAGDNFNTVFSFDNDSRFAKNTTLNDGFFYYQGIIPPNGQTIDLITNFAVPNTVPNFYNNKRAEFRVTIEAIQAGDAAAELTWGIPRTLYNTIFSP